MLILTCWGNPLSHTAETWVRTLGKESAWTVFWCCVKNWRWRSYLVRYGSCKLVKIASFGCKGSLWLVLTNKNSSLGELRHWGFIILLVLDWVLQVCDCEGCFGLGFCAEMCSGVWQGKRWQLCQIKPIDRCLLRVSAILNVWMLRLLIVPRKGVGFSPFIGCKPGRRFLRLVKLQAWLLKLH